LKKNIEIQESQPGKATSEPMDTLLPSAPAEKEELKKEPSEKELEYKDLLQRLQAEFDNYRQRTNLEKSRLIDYGQEEILKHLIEIYDQIEKADSLTVTAENLESFRQGIKLIKQSIEKIFEALEVEKVLSIGEPFNAQVHNAISTIPVTEEAQDGKIVAEVSPGFSRKKSLLTAAKVVVGKFGKRGNELGNEPCEE
jgi:molecular chaperone GrpE